jgi:hypothetical protein
MGAFDLAGELRVALGVRDGRVRRVAVVSTRPQLADRLLAGRTAQEAVATVPQLFSICGRSQQVAAELALAAARGAEAAADAAQAGRIEADMTHETLWRALIDWSRAEGGGTDVAALAAARAATAAGDRGALRAVVERDVLGDDARAWAQLDLAGFEAWALRGATAAARLAAALWRDDPRFGAGDVPLLPGLDEGEAASRIAAALDADAGFERAPTLDGRPAETGAIARQRRQPLVAALAAAFGGSTLVRQAARLVELARIAAGAASAAPLGGSVPLGPGQGLGWAETARGLLLHRVALDGGRVGRYRIVAPTEWNFHPQGAFGAAMLGAGGDAGRLRLRAERLLQSLDPCVAWWLEIGDA